MKVREGKFIHFDVSERDANFGCFWDVDVINVTIENDDHYGKRFHINCLDCTLCYGFNDGIVFRNKNVEMKLNLDTYKGINAYIAAVGTDSKPEVKEPPATVEETEYNEDYC